MKPQPHACRYLSRRQLLAAALVCLAVAALCGWAFWAVNGR